MSSASRRSAAFVAVVSVASAICIGPSMAGDDNDSKGDLVISKQGSFAFGGTVITGANGDTFHGDHGYAQYQIPRKARQYPLVMWHGGGQFSKTYETTPDGREGFQSLMLRKGYPVYIIDQPRRGRAGRGTKGRTIPNATPSESGIVSIFRLGVWQPPEPLRFFPGVQFPRDAKSLNQYWRQQTPDTGPGNGGATGVGEDAEVATDAVAKLFDKLGPAVLITHSASGILGWQTAIKSKNVKAIVCYEPTVFVYPDDETPPPAGYVPAVPVSRPDFNKLAKVPIQIIYGDNIATKLTGDFGVDLWVKSVPAAKAFAASVNAARGKAQVLELPKIGVLGNTHFPFSDLNNGKIADLLAKYLEKYDLDRYSKGRDDDDDDNHRK